MRRTPVLGLAVLLAACAPAPTVSPEQQAALRAAADACLAQYPTVARYEIDYFGHLVAWYKENQGQTAATEPFFDCVRAQLKGR